MSKIVCTAVAALLAVACAPLCAGDQPWVVYEGKEGPGKGKHIVWLAADEEYRSEEALPQLAKILATRHGFKCTVLFAINKKTGEIDPGQTDNIPGLELLKTADLMVMFIRWRDLPDDQTKHILDYVAEGKPILALRTATHPFYFKTSKTYLKYTWNYAGADYPGGFGRQILGETWVNHHGAHGKESTRGIIAPEARNHPVVRGIKDGDLWSPADVYTINLPMPNHPTHLVLGQVLSGMNPDDKPVEGAKNNPMMPIAWVRNYELTPGKTGRAFTTTLGIATDFTREGFRRLMVNAAYWALGMEDRITETLDVALVGPYNPTPFSFGGHKKGVKPADHRLP